MGKIRDFNWILNNGHFDRLVYGKGPNVFIFDSGTMIDLENHYFANARSGDNPASLVGRLEQPFVITPLVLAEIERHREMVVNRRFEISEATSILVHKIHEDYLDFLENTGVNNLNIGLRDYHKYMVYLAGNHCFAGDSRKGEKDAISETDREIVSVALDLSLGNIKGVDVGCVNILSPDAHVVRTVHALRGIDYFKNYKIRVIPTRNNLRSYMSK